MTNLIIDPEQNHLMIDLETFSMAPNAAVWELGYAHNFEGDPQNLNSDAFFFQSELFNAEGFDVNPTTVDWVTANCPSFNHYDRWLHDIAAAGAGERCDAMRFDLSLVADLMEEADHVWCKGADFDFPIIKNLYYQAGIRLPRMLYRKQRCFRTLWALCNEGTYKVDPTLAHGAENDAFFQLQGTLSVLRDLNL